MTKNENGLRLTGTGSTARRRAIETRRSRSISGKVVTGPITSLSVAARIDPATCSAVPDEDARILRERELEELRLLLDACVAWDRAQPTGEIRLVDQPLVDAIARALRCR